MSLLVFVVSVMPEYVYYLLSENYIFLFRSLFLTKPYGLDKTFAFERVTFLILSVNGTAFYFLLVLLRKCALGLCEAILSPIIFQKQMFERSLVGFYVHDGIHDF